MKGKRNAWKDFTNSNHSSSAKNAEMGWKKNPCFQQSPPRGRELIFVLPSTKEQGVPPARLFPLDGHFKSFAFYFQLQRLCNSHTCHRTVLFHTILERNTQIFIAYLTCIVVIYSGFDLHCPVSQIFSYFSPISKWSAWHIHSSFPSSVS